MSDADPDGSGYEYHKRNWQVRYLKLRCFYVAADLVH